MFGLLIDEFALTNYKNGDVERMFPITYTLKLEQICEMP